MSNRSACPERELFVGFLTGGLEDDQVENIAAHLADCDACGDTVRSLNINDTFSDLVSAARGHANAGTNDPPSELNDLLVRLESLADPQSVQDVNTAVGSRDDLQNRVQEVELLLQPAANEAELGRLAHYRILQLLGAGGMGVVYQAEDTQLKRLVALKILRPSLGRSARDRFVQEAQVAAAIDHDNVVTIYTVGREGPLAFLAMQWLEGETLEDRLKRNAPLSSDEVIQIGSQVAEGLAAAHAKKLIHRDIKPANIWLEAERERAKILDFGLAQIVDDDPQLTETGMIAGTPAYMSPEQAQGRSVDERSDLFSLGTMLYRMLTGELPFESSNALATIRSIQLDQPESPRQGDMSIPSILSDTVMDLLEKEPRDRPESASLVASCLVENKRPPHHNTRRAQRDTSSGSNRGGWWAAGIVATLVLGFAGYLAAPAVYRIVTDSAEITVNSNDPNVKVEVLQGGVVIRVIDTATDDSVTLRSGNYDLKVKGEQSNLSIEPNKVTLRRNDVETASVTRRKLGGSPFAKPIFATSADGGLGKSERHVDRIAEPSDYEILDEIEKDPRYSQLTAKIDEYGDMWEQFKSTSRPGAQEVEQTESALRRLRITRDERFEELRPRVVDRLKRRPSNPIANVTPRPASPPVEQKIYVVHAKHERAAELERKLGKLLPEANGLRVVSNGGSNSLVLTGTEEALQLASKLLKELDVERLATSEPEATFEGKPYSEWMNVLKTEKSTTLLRTAISAVGSLATPENSSEVCSAFRPIIRRYGHDFTLRSRTDSRSLTSFEINSSLRKLDHRVVANFVQEEMKAGTTKSRAFLTSLLQDHGSQPVLSSPTSAQNNLEFWTAMTPLANGLSEFLLDTVEQDGTQAWAVECLTELCLSLPNFSTEVGNTAEVLALLGERLKASDGRKQALTFANAIATVEPNSRVLVEDWLPEVLKIELGADQAGLIAKMGTRAESASSYLLQQLPRHIRERQSRVGGELKQALVAKRTAILFINALGAISSADDEDVASLLQKYATEDFVDMTMLGLKQAATDALAAIKARSESFDR